MKKSIIALAVAASMAGVAYADSATTLYGSIRMHYTYDDDTNASQFRDNLGNLHFKLKGTSGFASNGSRFGIKGEEDLGNGLAAFYKYENRIGGTLTTNKLYAGLKGGFGSVSFGIQNLPNDSLGNYADPFNALTPEAGTKEVGLDRNGKVEVTTTGRLAKTSSSSSLVYWSPDMSGFQIGVGLEADGTANEAGFDRNNNRVVANDNHIDFYDIVAKYEANGIFAGIGYQSTNGRQVIVNGKAVDTDANAVTLGLGYGNDAFEIGLLVDRYDVDGTTNNPVWARLSGLYNVSEMDAIYAGVSTYDPDVNGVKSSYQYSLGYQHKLSPRTRLWAEFSHLDYNDNTLEDDTSNKVSIGVRHDF